MKVNFLFLILNCCPSQIVFLLLGAAIAVNTKAVHHGDKGETCYIACAETAENLSNLLPSFIFYAAHKQHKAWAEHKVSYCFSK